MNRIVILVIALLAVTALILWVASNASPSFGNDGSAASFTYNAVLLVMLMSSLILGWRGSLSQALRYAAIWAVIFFAIVLAYSFRNDAKGVWQRVAGEVNPSMPIERSDNSVALRKSDDGHFYADVGVNGASIRMLVDTGATTIALSTADAARAGIDVDSLEFIHIVSTANGEAPAAEVHLSEVRVGSIVRKGVRAMVGRNLDGSLLGMNFFDTLSKFGIEADELVLKD